VSRIGVFAFRVLRARGFHFRERFVRSRSNRMFLGHDFQQRGGTNRQLPTKGRSYATIKNADAATPVANIANVMAEESRLSLCIMAIAISAQAACNNRAAHLVQWTCNLLMRIRCQRASKAFSSEVVISRCAIPLAFIVRLQRESELERLGEFLRNHS